MSFCQHMVRNVFICGAHSTGKTTLINYLRRNLKVHNGEILYSDEVARKLSIENNITGEALRDQDLFKNYNLQIAEEQYKREEEMANRFENTPNTKLCFFDRGALDPICYLRMTAGEEFANKVATQTNVSTLVERLRDKQKSVVFVTKPHEKYQEEDSVRIDYNFNDILKYDEIMQSMMTSFNIAFYYIEDDDVVERAKYVVDVVSSRWPELSLC